MCCFFTCGVGGAVQVRRFFAPVRRGVAVTCTARVRHGAGRRATRPMDALAWQVASYLNIAFMLPQVLDCTGVAPQSPGIGSLPTPP